MVKHTDYFDNGSKWRELRLNENGSKEGLCSWYREDGTKHLDINYLCGVRHGLTTQYNDAEKICFTGEFVFGRSHGTHTWLDDEQIVRTVKYKHGEILSVY